MRRVLTGGEHVGFEIRAEGSIGGQAIANHLLLVLTVNGGEVVAFREYVAWPDGVGDVTTGRDLLD